MATRRSVLLEALRVLRAERSLPLKERDTGAPDEALDAVIKYLEAGDDTSLAMASRSVVDSWPWWGEVAEHVLTLVNAARAAHDSAGDATPP